MPIAKHCSQFQSIIRIVVKEHSPGENDHMRSAFPPQTTQALKLLQLFKQFPEELEQSQSASRLLNHRNSLSGTFFDDELGNIRHVDTTAVLFGGITTIGLEVLLLKSDRI